MLYDKGEGSGDVFSGSQGSGGGRERAENKDWLKPINEAIHYCIEVKFEFKVKVCRRKKLRSSQIEGGG